MAGFYRMELLEIWLAANIMRSIAQICTPRHYTSSGQEFCGCSWSVAGWGCNEVLDETKLSETKLSKLLEAKNQSSGLSKHMVLLVAGAGFEPTTFGL